MTPDEIAAIKARADAATDGPWRFAGDPSCTVVDADSRSVAAAYNNGGRQDEDNATFIAHAREDVPALLAEVEVKRQVIDAKQAWIDGAKVDIDALTAERDEARAEVARLRDEVARLTASNADCVNGDLHARVEAAERLRTVARSADIGLDTIIARSGERVRELTAEVARLRAQVAAVEALCDATAYDDDGQPYVYVATVRAALAEHTGEASS